MKVTYEWKLELLIDDVDGKSVSIRARHKQMNDAWAEWKEIENYSPLRFRKGETVTYSFPFTIHLPPGGNFE